MTDWPNGAMAEAMAPLIHPVPVEVEVTVGRTWGVEWPMVGRRT